MKLQTPKTLPSIPIAPGAWPVLGHLPQMVKEQAHFLLEAERKVGPLFWLNRGFGKWSVVVAGEPAHTVMKNKATRSDVLGGDDDNTANHITKDIVVVADGVKHKRMRGALQGPFTPKGMTVAQLGSVLEEVAQKHIQPWIQKRSINILNETSEFALDIIFRMLGIPDLDLPMWRQKYNEFIGPWIILPFNFPGSPRWRSKKAAEWMDKEFGKLIEEARRTGDRETMLGAIVHGTDEEGQGLKPGELFANLRILGLAGHETTAATVAWMFIRLAHDKGLWEELLEEVMGTDGPPASPKAMEQFPKTEALFREVLRLYPVLSTLPPRRVEEPFEAHGTMLPKDTPVVASLISLSRDPSLYPDPDNLSLERWTKMTRRPGPTEAVQFGGGPHFCLGYHLALFEGVVFTVVAVRQLAEAGLRPVFQKPLPKPAYMPLTRPPAKLQIMLRPA